MATDDDEDGPLLCDEDDDESTEFFIFPDGSRIELTPEQHARMWLWFVLSPESAGDA